MAGSLLSRLPAEIRAEKTSPTPRLPRSPPASAVGQAKGYGFLGSFGVGPFLG